MPLPGSDRELEIVTQLYFGMPLHLGFFYFSGDNGRYEIKEAYNDYHGHDWKYTLGCTVGYSHSSHFWATVFGPLRCGGIARNSYGQFTVSGYRHKTRLKKWALDRGRGHSSAVRPAFVRLAERYGLGENIANRNRPPASGVLTIGREDGARGSFADRESQ